jgi:hypothetical protein
MLICTISSLLSKRQIMLEGSINLSLYPQGDCKALGDDVMAVGARGGCGCGCGGLALALTCTHFFCDQQYEA